jgi:ribosomal protein S17E
MDGLNFGYGFGDQVNIMQVNNLDSVIIPETSSLSVSVNSVENEILIFNYSDIISKTKVANRITHDLIKKYHAHFTELFNASREHIKNLETELHSLKNPNPIGRIKAIEFIPQSIEINDEIKGYIMEANLNGLLLKDVLPPNFTGLHF